MKKKYNSNKKTMEDVVKGKNGGNRTKELQIVKIERIGKGGKRKDIKNKEVMNMIRSVDHSCST